MTREKAQEQLPIIKLFANGERIQCWDSMFIVGTFHRGMWRDTEDMGFGASAISNYRWISDKMVIYFDGRLGHLLSDNPLDKKNIYNING